MTMLCLTWLMFPIGLIVLLVWRKRWWALLLGSVLCLAGAASALHFREAFVWQLDCIRGWSIRVPVEVGNYRIVLIQEAGADFYETTLQVVRSDGRRASILIDGDDRKWRSPRVLREPNMVFIVADNVPRQESPVIQVAEETVTVAGWNRGTYRLAELEYTPSQSK